VTLALRKDIWCLRLWADPSVGRRSKVDSASCSMQPSHNGLMLKGDRYRGKEKRVHSLPAISHAAAQSVLRRRATHSTRERGCDLRGRAESNVNSGVALSLKPNASRLLLFGAILVCLGGLGDVAYHVLPSAFATSLEPLVGAQGIRVHLLTLIGMLVTLAGVIWRGLRR
jgi:hypothetical protein